MADKYLGQNLIFIISMPRSGSTLLQRILAGHPDVGASSEPWIMLPQAYARRTKGLHTEYGAQWTVLGINEFIDHYTDGEDAYSDGVRAFAQSIYGNAMRKAGATRFVDKTPRYVLIVPELIRWFPEARFVFLLRNPLSVLASVVNTQIDHDLTSLEKFGNELVRGPKAMLDGIRTLGERATVVRYEDFVDDPEAGLATLCARIDLDFRPSMLEYSNTPDIKGVMQDRTGIQQHSRPTNQRAHAWKQMLTDAQQLNFARGYLDELGRETVTRMGYAWDELNAAVNAASSENTSRAYVFPWSVAILTPEQKMGRDQLQVFKYREIRDHGPVVGRLRTAVLWLRALFRAISYTFGSAKRVSEMGEEDNPKIAK